MDILDMIDELWLDELLEQDEIWDDVYYQEWLESEDNNG